MIRKRPSRGARAALLRALASGALGLALCAGPSPAWTQDSPPQVETGRLSGDLPGREQLEAVLELLESGADLELDAQQLERATQLRSQALLELDRLEEELALRADLDERRLAVPERIAGLRAELEAELPDPPEPPATSDVGQLEAFAEVRRVAAETARSKSTQHDGEVEDAALQREQLPELLAQLEQEASELGTALQIEDGTPPALREAQQEARALRRARVDAELARRRAQLEYLAAAAPLNELLGEQLARVAAAADRSEQAAEIALEGARDRAAGAAAESANRAAASASQVVQPIANEIALLAEENQEITQRIGEVTEEQAETDRKSNDLNRRFKSTRTKIEAVGLDNIMGIVLRQERSRLPDLQTIRSRLAIDQRAGSLRELRKSEVGEALAEFTDDRIETLGLRYLESYGSELSPSGAAEQQAEVELYLQREHETLRSLDDSLSQLIEKLDALRLADSRYLETAESYTQFINERVLWVQSAAPIWSWTWGKEKVADNRRVLVQGLSDVTTEPANQVTDLTGAVRWLLSPARWGEVSGALSRDAKANPGAWALGLGALVTLVAAGRALLVRLRRVAQAGPGLAAYRPLLLSLGTALALAAPLPALLALAGRRVDLANREADISLEFLRGLGELLPNIALLWLGLAFVQRCFRAQGLAEQHLGWDLTRAKRLSRSLFLFTGPFLLAHLVVGLLEFSPRNEAFGSTLGRMVFVFQMAWLALFARGLTGPPVDKQGDSSDEPANPAFDAHRNRPFLRRLARLWRTTALIAPILLAGLSLLGYQFTARQLFGSLVATLALVAGLYLSQAVVMRMVEVAKRKVAVARLRRSLQQGQAGQDPSVSSEAEEPASSLSEVSQQVRQLVATAFTVAGLIGFYLIWISEVPALGIFREIDLWSVQGAEELTSDAGQSSGVTHPSLASGGSTVTLADLLLAIAAGLVTFAAARRLPALLDILILERLRLTNGERYAYTTVLRYLVTLAGIIASFSLIRIGWNQVQFLAAAISVGLGFGLQEIFANFVSGLILLFERPVRIGDWVTIGSTSGQVTKIRIRATTLLDYEQRELIVPNKEFVTGQLINWTLTDAVSRMSLSVGVAYGSDTHLARRLMVEVAGKTKLVLDEPEPKAVFIGFGDSALDLRLDVYIPERLSIVDIQNDLHTGIDRAFKEAGLEIAFPQRDLHLRTAPAALQIQHKDAPPAAAGPAGEAEEDDWEDEYPA